MTSKFWFDDAGFFKIKEAFLMSFSPMDIFVGFVTGIVVTILFVYFLKNW